MWRAVNPRFAAEFLAVNVVVNYEVAVACEVGVVDYDKRTVSDFDGRGGIYKKFKALKRRGQIFSVSPRVDFFLTQKIIRAFIFYAAQIFYRAVKFGVEQSLKNFKVLSEKFRQTKFRQADFLPNFEFHRFFVKVNCQGAMIFVVAVAEKNKFVVVDREDFFQREAFNFGGQIFSEMKLGNLRGDFIFGVVLQKIFPPKVLNIIKVVAANIKPNCAF